MISIVRKVNCCLVIGWDKVGNTDVNLNSQKGDTNMFLLLPLLAHLPSTLRRLDGQQNTHQIFLKFLDLFSNKPSFSIGKTHIF